MISVFYENYDTQDSDICHYSSEYLVEHQTISDRIDPSEYKDRCACLLCRLDYYEGETISSQPTYFRLRPKILWPSLCQQMVVF